MVSFDEQRTVVIQIGTDHLLSDEVKEMRAKRDAIELKRLLEELDL